MPNGSDDEAFLCWKLFVESWFCYTEVLIQFISRLRIKYYFGASGPCSGHSYGFWVLVLVKAVNQLSSDLKAYPVTVKTNIRASVGLIFVTSRDCLVDTLSTFFLLGMFLMGNTFFPMNIFNSNENSYYQTTVTIRNQTKYDYYFFWSYFSYHFFALSISWELACNNQSSSWVLGINETHFAIHIVIFQRQMRCTDTVWISQENQGNKNPSYSCW